MPEMNLSHGPGETVRFIPCDGDADKRIKILDPIVGWSDYEHLSMMQHKDTRGKIARITITEDNVLYEVRYSSPRYNTHTRVSHSDGLDLTEVVT